VQQSFGSSECGLAELGGVLFIHDGDDDDDANDDVDDDYFEEEERLVDSCLFIRSFPLWIAPLCTPHSASYLPLE